MAVIGEETIVIDNRVCVVIHISDFVADKRVKFCTGMTLVPPEPDDKRPKTLCEACRQAILKRREL